MRESLLTTTGRDARSALGQPTLLPPKVTLPTYLPSPNVLTHPATSASIPTNRNDVRAHGAIVILPQRGFYSPGTAVVGLPDARTSIPHIEIGV